MVSSNIKTVLQSDVHHAWDVVTTLEQYQWRSDLSRVEIVDDRTFIEYTKDGYPTTFVTTVFEPCQRWEFDMENSNMKGHWIGVFTPKDGETEIEFTEYVTARKFFLKPFVKAYLKKQQTQFVADLKKALAP